MTARKPQKNQANVSLTEAKKFYGESNSLNQKTGLHFVYDTRTRASMTQVTVTSSGERMYRAGYVYILRCEPTEEDSNFQRVT